MDAYSFLVNNGLSAGSVDGSAFLSTFESEKEKGLRGEKSSLEMIATYAEPASSIPAGESVIVMDAGGTNFRTCLVTFDENGEAVISDFRKTGMPGVKEEVSAKEFFSILADNVERFMGRSKRIGFCFSYAATITEDHDGIPLMFSKEIKAPEVVGKRVGRELLLELGRRGYDVSDMKVSILNDTVATLLAAKAAVKDDASTFIGFILGTGTNTAYVEKNSNIGKIKASEGCQIINIESGNFHVDLSDTDKAFMETTKDRDKFHLEKKISGAYLGPFALFVLRKAAKEGVFSPSFSEKLSSMETFETKDLSAFLSAPSSSIFASPSFSDSDTKAAFIIVKEIVERAALLTALNLTAAVLASGEGESPLKPVVINADGTTFYKVPYLEGYVRSYLDAILTKKYGRFWRIVNIENSPVIGAAISGLTI